MNSLRGNTSIVILKYIKMSFWFFYNSPQSASKSAFGVTLLVTEKMPRKSKR